MGKDIFWMKLWEATDEHVREKRKRKVSKNWGKDTWTKNMKNTRTLVGIGRKLSWNF